VSRAVPAAAEVRDPLEWDALVASFPLTSALQGWGWGEVKRLSGWVPHRLRLERDGEVFAAAQVLRRRAGPGPSLLYAPRGPAMRALTDLDDVARALRAWAGVSDLSLKIEPSAALPSGSGIPPRLGPFAYAEPVQPEHTVLLDLTLPEDEALRRMHQMARRNTKTAVKMGVVGAEDPDFEAFWTLFTETNTRSSLMQHSRAYYEAVLREGNRYGGRAALITARFEGEPLASGLVLGLGEGLNYLYGGSTRERERREGERDPKASNGFYWGMIRWGAEHGFRTLDLFGIPRVLEETKHSYGVYQFKERLGGQKVLYPAYELPLSPLAPVVNGALRLRKNLMNYRARGSTQDVL
jgi:lipid II:glycine glycyltransferase (peptidoglycan interpeptide bridge formation enzyme)